MPRPTSDFGNDGEVIFMSFPRCPGGNLRSCLCKLQVKPGFPTRHFGNDGFETSGMSGDEAIEYTEVIV